MRRVEDFRKRTKRTETVARTERRAAAALDFARKKKCQTRPDQCAASRSHPSTDRPCCVCASQNVNFVPRLRSRVSAESRAHLRPSRREPTMSRGVRAVPALALFALACLCGLGSALAAERIYYWNEVTHTSTWEEPDVPVAFEDPESGKPYYFDAKTGESTWEFPGAWKEVTSEEHGQPYYHNAETGESTWEKPDVLGWKRMKVDEKEL